MSKIMPLDQAVRENLKDGDTVAFEGFTHLIPHAAGHEAIRQGFRDLTLIRMTPDIIYDQMIGMGMAKKVIFSYAGNPGVGLLRRMRDAIENQYPRAIETVEHSHAAMANAYAAGAAGLPCAVFRGSAQGQPRYQIDHLPLYRRGTSNGAGAQSRCRVHSRPEGQ